MEADVPNFSDDTDKITFFFDDPATPPQQHRRDGAHSVLYLLRRELLDTLGYNPDTDHEDAALSGGAQRRLFASTILMFTVCDLLAKFMFGDGGQRDGGQVGERFRAFLTAPDGAGMLEIDADLFWAVRNSLVHSFNMPPADKLAAIGLAGVALGQRKQADLRGWNAHFITERVGDVAIAYVDGILRMTLDAVSKYQETLQGQDSAQARARFLDMFGKYGFIRIA